MSVIVDPSWFVVDSPLTFPLLVAFHAIELNTLEVNPKLTMFPEQTLPEFGFVMVGFGFTVIVTV